MNLLVVYYSLYGHNLKMAGAAREGAESVSGLEVVFRRVAEFPEAEEWIQTNKYATTVAGPKNEIEPPPEDLEIAKALGQRVAQCTRKLRGR